MVAHALRDVQVDSKFPPKSARSTAARVAVHWLKGAFGGRGGPKARPAPVAAPLLRPKSARTSPYRQVAYSWKLIRTQKYR
mmetsp:Transcript_83327/g.269671  ORF Transcript_83327/g.269671 Transcript_83327/m.269671 type:complete len:81 (-) Transcript_83327:6-248(-)